MKEEMYKSIEAYLSGGMTSEEQIQFEMKMSKDPELAKEVKLSNQINHHFNEELWLSNDVKNSVAKQDIEEFIKSEEAILLRSTLEKVGKNYKETSNSSRLKYFISTIAAVFAIGLISTLFWNQKTDLNLLYDTYYTETDLPSIVKRGSENEFLKQGILAFKAKNYSSAINHFEDYIEETKGDDPLPYVYIGFSYLEMNDIDKALSNFDILLNSNSIDNSKGLWYKCLVYLKVTDKDGLDNALLLILSDSNNFNYQKAIELQKDLH